MELYGKIRQETSQKWTKKISVHLSDESSAIVSEMILVDITGAINDVSFTPILTQLLLKKHF